MKKLISGLFAIALCLAGNAYAYQYGSGLNERDLEMGQYSIDGRSDTGLRFDGNNDGTDDMTLEASGRLTLGAVSYPATDGTAGYVLATDGAGTIAFAAAGGVSDGDKGEVTVASSGTVWTLDDNTTVTGWVMGASTATTPSADDNDTSLATSAYVQTEINAMGGRSLTAAAGSMDADAELYTNGGTLWIQDPTASDDLKTTWVAPTAVTITAISCESDQTVNFDLQVDDGTPTGVNGSDIACTTFATDSSLAGDVTLAAGDRLDLAVTSVSGTPTWVSISWKYTNDD